MLYVVTIGNAKPHFAVHRMTPIKAESPEEALRIASDRMFNDVSYQYKFNNGLVEQMTPEMQAAQASEELSSLRGPSPFYAEE